VNKRNYSSFLDEYYKYAADGFCPNKFHYWTGISLIAGALERKVFIKQDKYNFYPNLYIMLVSGPGMGKSSAMSIGVTGLLSQLDGMNFIPQHITEAKLVEIMSHRKSFYQGNKELIHSSAYWYASEGSNVLEEKKGGGDIIPMITDLYDCPVDWKKGTKIDGILELKNLCLNMLSGLTFDFAKRLILGANSAGGFASRNIYVVHNQLMVRHPTWESISANSEVKQKLIADLHEINKMTGQFKLTK